MVVVRISPRLLDRSNFPHCTSEAGLVALIVRRYEKGMTELKVIAPPPGLIFCEGPAGAARDAYSVTIPLQLQPGFVGVEEIEAKPYAA